MNADGRAVLRVQGVGRRFGRRTALEGVDLELQSGELVGLAGANGSGKTTLLKLLAGLLRPHAGRIEVLGHDPFRERVRAMRAARFVFAPPPVYEHLSAREQVLHVGRLSDPRLSFYEVDASLDRLGLLERAADRVREFSFGMRTRLALAGALLPPPALLVLDEPTDGLDPLAVLELRGVLRGLANEGLAVLLASHLMLELEELVDRLLVLDRGRPLFMGAPKEWTRGSERLLLGTSDCERAKRALLARWPGLALRDHARGLEIVPLDGLDLESARAALGDAGLALHSFSLERASLEQVLLVHLCASRGERS